MSEFKCAIQPCVNKQEYMDGKCSYHYRFGGASRQDKKLEAAIEKAKGVKKVAEHTATDLLLYEKERKQYLKDNPECMIKKTGCTKKSKHVHHTKGRLGPLLLDKKHWKAVCDGPCHGDVTDNSKQAIEDGHSKPRHRKG